MEDTGTSERTPAMARLLGHKHDVVGLPSPGDRHAYDTTRARAPRFAVYLIVQTLAALRGLRLARKYGARLVFCETPHHALVGLWIARMRRLPCVWDSHGNALLFARSTSRGWFYTFLTSSLDRFLGRHVDLLLTVSRKDADAYETLGVPASRTQVIPTSVDLAAIDRELSGESRTAPGMATAPAKKVLIFFGSFGYRPNVDALEFISKRVAPFLERHGVAFEIQVAGRDLPKMVLHASVIPVGFVEDLHRWIRKSDLCIVPVWRGVGILTKALDVMATGTPIVASNLVVDGIPEIRDGIHAAVCSEPDEFPQQVLLALGQPARMAEMARNARRLIEERYDWKVHEDRLDALITSLISPPDET